MRSVNIIDSLINYLLETKNNEFNINSHNDKMGWLSLGDIIDCNYNWQPGCNMMFGGAHQTVLEKFKCNFSEGCICAFHNFLFTFCPS